MTRRNVLEAAIEKYNKIMYEAAVNLGLPNPSNAVDRQWFKNGAWFGYKLALRELCDNLQSEDDFDSLLKAI